ncbi:hypothetical protein B0A49_01453 [Cryomyces minteri]|uniref:Arabinogalactan endo-beta-1,4-galactanase n=1 Tax=Cryomyces minteri TaxID=331657 RepID=A0A4U0XSD8_9PEZI|nr:hypothetical protein B0A49_01453 [Cryomyces minteri]
MHLLHVLAAALPLCTRISALPSSDYQHREGKDATFYKGFDLSSVATLEERGVVYKDTQRNNRTRPVEDILGDGGMNTVRLRLWVNPTPGLYTVPGNYDLNYTLTLTQRFSKKGYKIYLDYHFSDYWAEPGHNNAPLAWPTDLAGLSSTLRAYVKDTLVAFAEGGIDLSLVSLGNEIRNGMLWPLGRVDVDLAPAARAASFSNLATLYASAPEAWFGALTATGKVSRRDWDVFGFSSYPFYGTSATLQNLQTSLNAIGAAYGEPVHVVETDWPAICDGPYAPVLSDTSVPISPAGQIEWVRDIVRIVKAVPNGLGQGVNYWEPAWLNNTGLGSSCQDAILFDADWSEYPTEIVGYSRPSVNMFKDV